MAQITTPTRIARRSQIREISLVAGILVASVVATLVTGLFIAYYTVITSSVAIRENGFPFPWWEGTHYFSNITRSWSFGFFFLDVLFYDALALLILIPYQRKRGLGMVRSDVLVTYALYAILAVVFLAAAVEVYQVYEMPRLI
jgi:hypothetical protein